MRKSKTIFYITIAVVIVIVVRLTRTVKHSAHTTFLTSLFKNIHSTYKRCKFIQ